MSICPSATIHSARTLNQLVVPDPLPFEPADVILLRDLAKRVEALAARPCEDEKRRLWTRLNDLTPIRPVSFCYPEFGWNEILPQDAILCSHPLARVWEMRLRKEIVWGERFMDDRVIEKKFRINHLAADSGWGLDEERIGGEDGGAYTWKAPLEDYERDFPKLRLPEFTVDWNGTHAVLEYAREVLGDILEVELYRDWVYSVGMTKEYIMLRGMENLMTDFYDEPDWVHRTMAFLRDGFMHRLDLLEEQGLLCRNTGGQYVGSGGCGWTAQLPPPEQGGRVLARDLWGLAESQETVGVSPGMFAEFVFPYQLPLMERYGMNCYGCCEPLDQRWHIVKLFPRLRRVSVSAWADVSAMAENLGGDYVFSWKPNPAWLATPAIDGERIRRAVRDTLDRTRGCAVEIIMKDNHTLGGNPEHAVRWCRIVQEEIERAG